jgi:hypothetical protein
MPTKNLSVHHHSSKGNPMSRVLVFLFIVVLMPLLFPFPGFGQSGTLTPEQLTARSEVVAVGTVSDLRSEWNSDRTRITTRVTLAVEEYLKGTRSERILVLTAPGGEVGSVGEVYSHMARFQNNEQVVVFAERDGTGGFRVSGGEQGKLTVHQDPATRKPVVSEGLSLEVLKARIGTAARVNPQR